MPRGRRTVILEPLKIKIALDQGVYLLDMEGALSELGSEVWLCFNNESFDLYKYGSEADVLGFYHRCRDAFLKIGNQTEVQELSIGQWKGGLNALNLAVETNSLDRLTFGKDFEQVYLAPTESLNTPHSR